MSMFHEAMTWLKKHSDGGKFTNPRQMAIALGLDPSATTKLYKSLKGSVPQSDALMGWLEGLGVRLIYPDAGGKRETANHLDDPLVLRVETVTKTLREQGVAELEILRAVRSMLDAEIDKASSRYLVSEARASFSALHEEPAPYKDIRHLRIDPKIDPKKES